MLAVSLRGPQLLVLTGAGRRAGCGVCGPNTPDRGAGWREAPCRPRPGGPAGRMWSGAELGPTGPRGSWEEGGPIARWGSCGPPSAARGHGLAHVCSGERVLLAVPGAALLSEAPGGPDAARGGRSAACQRREGDGVRPEPAPGVRRPARSGESRACPPTPRAPRRAAGQTVLVGRRRGDPPRGPQKRERPGPCPEGPSCPGGRLSPRTHPEKYRSSFPISAQNQGPCRGVGHGAPGCKTQVRAGEDREGIA